MATQIGELTFLKHLAGKFEIPIPEYVTADAPRAEVRTTLGRWDNKGIVKPDVLSGKRGKAGAIDIVTDAAAGMMKLKTLSAAEVNGKVARTSYMVQYIPAEMEVYSAITYDSQFLVSVLTVCMSGGIDVENVGEDKKRTIPIDAMKGLNAYQVSAMLEELNCPQQLVSRLSQVLVNFSDMFKSTGMQMAEINPWRITPDGKIYACDFKGVFDETNYKFSEVKDYLPEYPQDMTEFEEEMAEWSSSSHQGQAHVAELGGSKILPILFGGGASTIIIETLMEYGGDPIFLSDFGGNPPYDRMYGTAERCLSHKLKDASLLLILGGKANNTYIDVTFQAIADALRNYVDRNGPLDIPVVIGRGGPRLVQGMVAMQRTLEDLRMPYVIFGPDTPITLVAEYAARLVNAFVENTEITP